MIWRAFEIAVEALRGVAITLIAAWLFILAWLVSTSPLGNGISPGGLFLAAALMAGTAVYFLAPALLPLGCLLGYLSAGLASSPLRRRTAVLAGGGLGLVAGASSAWLGITYFGREVLPPTMSAHPVWIALSAALFAATLVAGYVGRLATSEETEEDDRAGS